MDIELDPRKSMRQNLSEKYAELRKLKEKKAGLLTAIAQTKKEMEELEKKEKTKATSSDSKNSRASFSTKASSKFRPQKKKSNWYDAYLTFVSSASRRVVAGKNAKQNDELYAKHLAPSDLFFHADIQGAPTVILKDGQKASEEEKKEAAQWAASYSSAWKVGAAAVDVFAVQPDQVSKHDGGGYVGPGSFVLSGEREWFRQMPLKLKIGKLDGQLAMLPAIHPKTLDTSIMLSPGSMPKEETAKLLSARLGVKVEEVAPLLPGGKFVIA